MGAEISPLLSSSRIKAASVVLMLAIIFMSGGAAGQSAVEGIEWAAPESEDAWAEDGSLAGGGPGWSDQLEAFKRKHRDGYGQLKARSEQERVQAELEAQRRAREQQAAADAANDAGGGLSFNDVLGGLVQGMDIANQGLNQYMRQSETIDAPAFGTPSANNGCGNVDQWRADTQQNFDRYSSNMRKELQDIDSGLRSLGC